MLNKRVRYYTHSADIGPCIYRHKRITNAANHLCETNKTL